MPKQVKILNDFSGGLNNLKNARDIADNELYNIQNAMVDMQGGIGITPRFTSYSSTVPDIADTVPSTNVGYGLGVFETDFEYTPTSLTVYALGSDELNGRGASWFSTAPATTGNTNPTDHGWSNKVANWTSSGWALNGNQAAHSDGGGTHYIQYKTGDDSSYSNALSSGMKYRIKYTLSSRTSGSFTFKLAGNGSQSSAISTNGTSYIDLTAGTTTLTTILVITPTNDFDGTLDDIEVRLVQGGGSSGGLFFSTTTDSAGDNINLLTAWAYGNSNDSNNNNINLVSSFPVGSWIKISDAKVNTGLLVSLNSGNSANEGLYQIIGTAAAGDNGSSLYLHKPVTTENYVKATITGIKSTGETLILNADAPTGNIAVYTRVNPATTWAKGDSGSPFANAKIDLRPAPSANYSPASEMQVRYYKTENAIRCCDTLKTNGNVIKWFGLINFTQWLGTGAANPIFGYEQHNNRLEPPTDGHVYPASDLADGTVNGQIGNLDAGTGFSLFIKSSDDEGTYSIGTGQQFEFAQSFIYDGNQESLLKVYAENLTAAQITDLKSLDMRVIAKGQDDYNHRVTGGRIYIRVENSGDPWALLVDMDFEKGGRTSLDAEWYSWVLGITSTYSNSVAGAETYLLGTSSGDFQSQDPSIVTYEVINGFQADVKTNSFGYQMESWSDAVVTNSRAFVCNIQYVETDSGGATNPKKFPDRIMYSMPNRYDTFPEMNIIEAVRGDSDGYIALSEHADRLLAFKERSMQLINIASPSDANWFLEESYKWMGVLHPEAVQETPYGVIWINPYGLYLYSGSGIKNLIENKVDPSYWKPKITASSIISYDQINAHILIQYNTHASSTAGAIFDLKKNTIVKQANLITGSYTNMVINPNDGNLFYGVKDSTATDFYYYDGTDRTLSSSLDNVTFTTKDIDFGDPSSIKKVYKVMVTYKSSAAIALNLKYYINSVIPAFASATSFSTVTADSASDWEIGTWEITGGVICQSFGLIFESTNALTSLDINDISIEYRVIRGRKVVAT
tara:strand:+ start:575 stop:3637 length:3063 start_codon:yes stop_codon:yes gene_type:complete